MPADLTRPRPETSSSSVETPGRRLRQRVRPLLDLIDPADGLAAYYTLFHEPKRTQLHLYEDDEGRALGFVAVCQTGRSLFQPTVVLRAPDTDAAVALLGEALVPGRPYYVVTTPELATAVEAVVHIEHSEQNRVYRLNPLRLDPRINVLVVSESALGGFPRFVIRSGGEVAAASGVNWRSPHFAEVYVYTVPRARGRGWGKAVVTACCRALLGAGVKPLYMVTEGNEASMQLAESAGFEDTGAREFAAEGVRRF